MTLAGLLWGAVSYYYSPLFFWWLSPVLLGMVTSVFIIRFTSSIRAGEWLQRHGLLCIPAEVRLPEVLERLEEHEETAPAMHDVELDDHVLLPGRERRQDMPVQSLRAPFGLGGAQTPV